MRRLAALLLLLPLACSGGKGGGDEGGQQVPGPPAPPPSGTVTPDPTVPSAAAPPVGVTWHVGFTENVTLARMQSFYASLVATNNAVFDLSEGQVRVARIRFFDGIAPGVSASQLLAGGVAASNIDILVFSGATWDVPMVGAVAATPGLGRTDRLMILPESPTPFILLHEASHLLFRLTWGGGPLLLDEYNDGVQDIACVMESENHPQRWCSDPNHSDQLSQPHSCWRQILLDYPSLRHTSADLAGSLPAAPIADYNDTP